jgi:RNA polymerase sigma-70 factor (ECF subfamily)
MWAPAVIGAEFDAVLAGAQSGDEAAVARLYRDLDPLLVRFLVAQAPEVGEDLAQDVWLAAAKGLGSFSGDEQGFRAWMFTIARRHLIGHWRRQGRRPQRPIAPVDMSELAVRSGDEPDARVLADEAVRALVACLPREQAEIVLLRVIGGLDAEEVGLIVGKRPGTVRVLQHRALRRLAEQFSADHVTT